jgi:Zn-finger nucleic acid-binding protein
VSSPAPQLCPRCHVQLHAGHTRNECLWGCANCGGVWLDSHASQRLTQALDAEALSLADAAARHAAERVDTSAKDLACPVCEQPLVRRHVDRANVELDDCAEHGTWFDANELQTVARAMAAARAYGGGGPGLSPGGGAPAATAQLRPQSKTRSAIDKTNRALETTADVAAVGAAVAIDSADVGGGLLDAFSFLGDLFDVLG